MTPVSVENEAEPGRERRDRGIALVAVLWITALLALLAAGIGSSSRTELRLAYNAAEQAKANALADAGIHQALFDLLQFETGRSWQGAVISHQFALDGGDVRVMVHDEDGKIDVNVASLELLRGLLMAVGIDEESARTLADRIGDFRDADSDAEPLGAEDSDYEAAGLSKGAADRPFLMTSELSDVLGMSDEIYRLIRPHVTVYADADGVDPNRASRIVLEALPGMTPEIAARIIASDADDDPLMALPGDVAADLENYVLPSRDLFYSIEAFGRSEGGGQVLREAILSLDGGVRALPATLHVWRRGTIDDRVQR